MKRANITFDKAILGGKPIIKGTRIAVSTILDLLAVGLSQEEILKEYPILKKSQVQNAISFASQRMKREANYPLKRRGKSVQFTSV